MSNKVFHNDELSFTCLIANCYIGQLEYMHKIGWELCGSVIQHLYCICEALGLIPSSSYVYVYKYMYICVYIYKGTLFKTMKIV